MKRETYLEKISEAEQLVTALHTVCALLEQSKTLVHSSTYRAAMSELHTTQSYIDRTKKKIGAK